MALVRDIIEIINLYFYEGSSHTEKAMYDGFIRLYDIVENNSFSNESKKEIEKAFRETTNSYFSKLEASGLLTEYIEVMSKNIFFVITREYLYRKGILHSRIDWYTLNMNQDLMMYGCIVYYEEYRVLRNFGFNDECYLAYLVELICEHRDLYVSNFANDIIEKYIDSHLGITIPNEFSIIKNNVYKLSNGFQHMDFIEILLYYMASFENIVVDDNLIDMILSLEEVTKRGSFYMDFIGFAKSSVFIDKMTYLNRLLCIRGIETNYAV